MHRPFGIVFIGHGRPEQRHDRVANELIDRATIGLDHWDELREARVHHPADFLGVHSLGEGGKARNVGKQHRHLAAFTCQGGQRGRSGRGGRRMDKGLWSCRGVLARQRGGDRRTGRERGGRSVSCPDQHFPRFIHGEPLALNEFGLQVLQVAIIQVELALERAIRQAAAPLEQSNCVVKDLLKGHRPPSLCR